jgi:hypothetical protein
MNSQIKDKSEQEIILEDDDDDDDEKKTSRTQVVFDGATYDLEDGRLVSYIEIYIPFFRKYIKIDSCDFFKYIFGTQFFE